MKGPGGRHGEGGKRGYGRQQQHRGRRRRHGKRVRAARIPWLHLRGLKGQAYGRRIRELPKIRNNVN